MYLNGIDFPNEILDSIRNDRLVVFAGAGASVDKPTSLPNFYDLTKEIADGTGRRIGKKDSCEVFLGSLKAQGINVNQLAANILSASCLKHNQLHEAIISLFSTSESLKIVTTNYDQMFEQVCEEQSILTPVYNAPALPLGNDIHGIIHIHGNVNSPKYMVVTDEDFGKAYLTDGYASRFLVELFRTYTVLFIGYSYSDTILRYLTRAMSRQYSPKRFILTDDTKSDWNALGISCVTFPKRGFRVMREGLLKLGIRAKRGLVEWNNQFIDIADAPPKDLTIETEIDYCLGDVEKARVLANCIHGKEWLDLLDKKGVFRNCFTSTSPLSDFDKIWASWLCEKFIGTDDLLIKQLFIKYGSTLSPAFAELMIRAVAYNNSSIGSNCLSEYILLLEKYTADPYILLHLIEETTKRGLVALAFLLFKKLCAIRMMPEYDMWSQRSSISYTHSFCGDHFHIQQAWKFISPKIDLSLAKEAIQFVKSAVEDLHFKYEIVGSASESHEPWDMAMLEIENEKQYGKENPLIVLNDVFLEACKTLQLIERNSVREFLIQYLSSCSVLLQKMSLRAIRECDVFTAEEEANILLSESLLSFMEGKQQVFLLVASIFNSISDQSKQRLLDSIDQINDEYSRYNWYVWLQRIAPANHIINERVHYFQDTNGFAPREHPERTIVFSSYCDSFDISPISETELIGMSDDLVIPYILSYDNNSFSGPSKEGLMKTVSNCVKNSPEWGLYITKLMIKQGTDDSLLWNRILYSISDADYSFEQLSELVQILVEHTTKIPCKKAMADLLWKILEKDNIKNVFSKYENLFFNFSEKIWDERNTEDQIHSDTINDTLNTTTGIILLCWIYMVSHSSSKLIPENYQNHFNAALGLHSWEKDVAVCILTGHFNFFCYRDKKWSIDTFTPLLTSSNPKAYISAWSGIAYYSRRINKDFADILAPIYLKAVKHVEWLTEDVKKSFIELFLTLLIHIIDQPTQKYIPEFYRASIPKTHQIFIDAIGSRLKSMDSNERVEWWNKWLKHFIENRKQNKPVPLSDPECAALFVLILNLDDVLGEAITCICKGCFPVTIDRRFWYSLDKKGLATSSPTLIAQLVIRLLSSGADLGHGSHYIPHIVDNLKPSISPELQKQLNEGLLKHNLGCTVM